MTLQEFSRDIVPIIQSVITLLGLGSLLLLWQQIREARRWNQAVTQVNLLRTGDMIEIEAQLLNALRKVDVKLCDGTPLTMTEMDKICGDRDVSMAVSHVLADFEATAVALSTGVGHDDYAFALLGPRLVDFYKIFEPLIERKRAEQKERGIYIEFQKTALRWEERLLRESAEHAKRQAKLDRQIEKQNTRLDRLRKLQKTIGGATPSV